MKSGAFAFNHLVQIAFAVVDQVVLHALILIIYCKNLSEKGDKPGQKLTHTANNNIRVLLTAQQCAFNEALESGAKDSLIIG